MTLTAGALTSSNVQSNTAVITTGVATSGTAPYTYQLYRSTTTGFTPGSGNLISGATTLVYTDSGLIPNTVYFYKSIVTDSASATATSSQITITTTPQQLSQNQLTQTPIGGQVDMPFNTNTLSVVIDGTQTGTLYPGTPVKFITNAGPGTTPHVVACTADTDGCCGFIEYDVKQLGFTAGTRANISRGGNVIYLYATSAINAGAQVQLDLTATTTLTSNGVTTIVPSSGANIVGWALDYAPAPGALIRVVLSTPSFAFA